ncbi:MAG: tetratricopeptide repeat protein [Desulfonatronovibrionaceae bacterium]
MGQKDKISRRDFFRGVAKKMGFREWSAGDMSGLHPKLREADDHLKNQDYARARESYDRFLEEEPAHIQALRMAGYCCLRLMRTEEARKYWDEAERLRPKDEFCVLYRGLSHAREGSLDQAVEAWKSYFNIHKPQIQREINVTLAWVENGEELNPQEVADSIEQAIARQKKGRSG